MTLFQYTIPAKTGHLTSPKTRQLGHPPAAVGAYNQK